MMLLLCYTYILSFVVALGLALQNELPCKAKQKTGGLDMLCEAFDQFQRLAIVLCG